MQTDDGFAMGNGSNRIMSLNGLRYPCVAMVAFTHFQLVEHCCPTDIDLSKWSVTFFFILSGFVLSIGYADKVLSRDFDYKKYIVKRIAHIYPLHLLCLAAYAAMYFRHFTSADIVPYVLSALLVQSWIPDLSVCYAGNAVAWFLSSLLPAYLLFPVVVRGLQRHSRWLLPSVLVVEAVYYACCSMITDSETIIYYSYICPVGRFFDFFMGMALYRLYRRSTNAQLLRPGIGAACAETAAVALVVATVLWHLHFPLFARLNLIYIVPCAVLIIVLAVNRSYVSRLLASKPLQKFGDVSFTVFITHLPCYYLFGGLMHIAGIYNASTTAAGTPAAAVIPDWLHLAIYLVAVTAISFPVTRYIVAPVSRRIIRRIDG